MYEELVKKIRHCATDPMHCLSCGEDKDGRCFKRLMMHAADAIEELQKPKTGTWHRVKASKRSYMFVCNSCDKMYPFLTRCCPNCGVLFIDEEPPKEERA